MSRSAFKVRRLDGTNGTYHVAHLARRINIIVLFYIAGRLGEGFFQGLPISLNGVQKVLDFMDWQDGEVRAFVSNPIQVKKSNLDHIIAIHDAPRSPTLVEQGEQYEGMRAQGRLVFGEVGEEHIENGIDTYILIAPQVNRGTH